MGWPVGDVVGLFVGSVVGAIVGAWVGETVGTEVGCCVGEAVGIFVGAPVGCIVGGTVGAFVGTPVGVPVGLSVRTKSVQLRYSSLHSAVTPHGIKEEGTQSSVLVSHCSAPLQKKVSPQKLGIPMISTEHLWLNTT